MLNHYGYDDLSLILFFIAILDLAHVYQNNEESQSELSKIDYWTSKIEKSNNTYDEARVVEQWSKDFNDRTDWIWGEDEDYLDEEDMIKHVEKFNEKLTEDEREEQEELKKHAQRIRIEDKDIQHNVQAGIVRDKK